MSPRDEARAEEIRQWTAANQRAREEYAERPFAHSPGLKKNRTVKAIKQEIYRKRQAKR